MAGRRRTVGRRSPDGQVRPVGMVERARRIRSAARARYAAAQDDRDRLAVALDYTRAAAAAAGRAGLDPGDVLDDVTRALMAAGDSLTSALATDGRRR